MPDCNLCTRNFEDEYEIFEQKDGQWICEECLVVKHHIDKLFDDLIKEEIKDLLTEEAIERLMIKRI